MKALYTCILLLAYLSASAQMNVDLYRIEKEGDRALTQGRFDDAIEIYKKYKIISNGIPIPDLDRKIVSTEELKSFYAEANRAYRSQKYVQSIDKFKQYRKLFPGMSIKSIDSKIEDALVEIERQGKLAELAEKEKIIYGFEKTYQAEKAMENGDLSVAKKLYDAAVASVHQVRERNSVMELATKRIKQIYLCTGIQERLKTITETKKQIELLESYKSNGGLIVRPLEDRIVLLRLQSEQETPGGVEKELNRLALTCQLDALLIYLKNSDAGLYQPVSKEALYKAIYDFNVDLTEIRNLKTYGDESQRNRFVFGGYEALIKQADDLQIVGNSVKECLQREYSTFLYVTAKRILDEGLNPLNAREIAINAKQFVVSAPDAAKVDDLIQEIKKRIGCEGIVRDLMSSITIIEANLQSCKLNVANDRLQAVNKSSVGCLTPQLEQRILTVTEATLALKQKTERIALLKMTINDKLQKTDCASVGQYLDELNSMTNCNQAEITAFVLVKRGELSECIRKKKLDDLLYSVNSTVDNIRASMGNIAAEKAKLYRAESLLQNAQTISLPGEKEQITQLKNKIEGAWATIKDVEVTARKNRRRNYLKLIKPELYFAAMYLDPTIEFGTESVKTSGTFLGNYEVGLNFRFLKRENMFNHALGVHYATNEYKILDDKNYLSEQVNAEFITSEYKITTGFKRNSHPYLGLGIGLKWPIKVNYQDEVLRKTIQTAYFQPNNYVNTHVFSTFSIGYESHRKNVGFSVECFVRLSGSMVESDTKKSVFPVLKQQNFKFSQGSAAYYNSSMISWGLSFTTHLW